MTGRFVALQLEPDEPALRVLLAFEQSVAADEVLVVGKSHGESDPGLERVDLVVELVAGEDQSRLDAQDVERLEPERLDAERLAGAQMASHTASASDGWQNTS